MSNLAVNTLSSLASIKTTRAGFQKGDEARNILFNLPDLNFALCEAKRRSGQGGMGKGEKERQKKWKGKRNVICSCSA